MPSKRNNDTPKSSSGEGYTIHVNLRFKQEEYDKLEAYSRQLNCSISQAIRILLFKNKQGFVQNKDALINGIRQDFKKLSGEYTSISNDVKKAINDKNKNALVIERCFLSLETITLTLQKKINELFHSEGKKEIHAVSRTKLPGGGSKEKMVKVGLTKADIEYIKERYYYMETILIIGNLTEDAKEYTREEKKKMRFTVAVDRLYDDGKERILYTVFADKEPVFEYLKKGTGVHVMGTFTENRKTRDKVVFPFPHEIRLTGNLTY